MSVQVLHRAQHDVPELELRLASLQTLSAFELTVIVGPSFDSVFHASQPPIAIATSGMSQITGNRRERRVAACTGAGGLGRSLIAASVSAVSSASQVGHALPSHRQRTSGMASA